MNKDIIKKMYSNIDGFLHLIFFSRYFYKKHFLNILEKELEGCTNVLEIGSGKTSYLRDLESDFKITALDISLNQIRESRKNQVYNNHILGDVLTINQLIKPGSFDAIVAMDLIEHLDKEKGLKLISDLSSLAKKIIIYTPNGFLFQPPTADNPFQEHLSGWDFDEMQNLGFKVFGVNGYKRISGVYSLPKIRPASLGIFIRNLSALGLRMINMEHLSFSILCIKDTKVLEN
jgi:hypothetical protein